MDFNTMDSSIFDHSKLRGRIIEKFGTLDEFYSHLGISSVAGSKKMQCKIGLSRKDILKWCYLLDIKLKDIPLYFFVLKV